MVQPGITGWAQVNYPYGSTVDDAKRKLEYDLYYTKNMSLFLDLFILLDTVRIIVRGGLHAKKTITAPAYHGHFKRDTLGAEPAKASWRRTPILFLVSLSSKSTPLE